jgi:predicted dehydrogenase
MAYGMSGKVFHAPFLAHHPGFRLKAVVERNHKLASADYPQVQSYNSVDELLADDSIDLVVVNTPNYTHYEFTKKALLASKHVLAEKPFTTTSDEAEDLFALAKQCGKQLMVYQNRRCDSGFKLTKSIIESGQLGKLTEIHFRFDRYRNEIGKKDFKERSRFAASGLLYDLGPHLIDQAICLFGTPEDFYKVTAKNRVGSQVDDYFFIHLAYPKQLNIYLTATLLAADIPPAFVVNGSLGTFTKNHGDVQEAQLLAGMRPADEGFGIEQAKDAGRLCLVANDGTRNISKTVSPQGNYGEIFEAVYQTLSTGVAFPVTEEQIISQLKILQA